MAIPVKLPVFEGPLDLLLHLIEKNKIDIYDIPIVQITDQYLDYVRQMDREDMDVMSEFLVMAATLLDIKSRMLLPREKNEETGEEEGDPREELVRRLLEYKMYKYLSEELAVCREQAGVRYFRAQNLPKEVRNFQPPIDYDDLLGNADLKSLQKVFGEVLRRKKNRRDPVRSGFGKISREEVNIDTKTLYIRAYLQAHPRIDFRELLESRESREEVIVTFLILLELMKHQMVHIEQDVIGGKILVVAGKLSDETENGGSDVIENGGSVEAENNGPDAADGESQDADMESSSAGEEENLSQASDLVRDGSRALLASRNAEVTALPGTFFMMYAGADSAVDTNLEAAPDTEAEAGPAAGIGIAAAGAEAALVTDIETDSVGEVYAGGGEELPHTQCEDVAFESFQGRGFEDDHLQSGGALFRCRELRLQWRKDWVAHCLKAKNRRNWGYYWTAPGRAAQDRWNHAK